MDDIWIGIVITRKNLPPGQITLYKALFNASDNGGSEWMTHEELADAMRWGKREQVGGVLGALGGRVNKTKGIPEQPGLNLIVERKDGLLRLQPAARVFISSQDWLKAWIALDVDEIHRKCRSRGWPSARELP